MEKYGMEKKGRREKTNAGWLTTTTKKGRATGLGPANRMDNGAPSQPGHSSSWA